MPISKSNPNISGTSVTSSDLEIDEGTLSVDATNNRVGVNTTSPGATLGVDGDLHFQPTTISTSHITTAGSLDVRCTDNMKLGTDGADSVRIGRVNTSSAKVHIRSGADTDLVVSGGKVGIGMEDPSDALEIDGDIQLTPTAITTAHLKTTGSLDIRCTNNLKLGTDGADSVRLGRTNTAAAKIHLRSGADTDLVVFNSQVGIGTETPKTSLTVEGTVTLKEQADADGDTAGYGQLWVNTATPNELYFTTDAGDDIQLTSGTGMAETGDITGVTAGTLLDGGGTSGGVTLNVDLTEAGAATIAAGDYVLFLDGGTTGTHAKGSINDVATLMAGTASATGLSASSGVLTVSDLHSVGVSGSANQLITDDGDGTVTSESTLTYDGSTLMVGAAITAQTSAGGSAHGAGADAINPYVKVRKINDEVVTTVSVDLGAGAGSKVFTSSNAALARAMGHHSGGTGSGAAYVLGPIAKATHGLVYHAEMVCLETPAGGSADIDIIGTTTASHVFNAAVSGTAVVSAAGGHAEFTSSKTSSGNTLTGGLDGMYLYLCTGDASGTHGNYSAGKFDIILRGRVELADGGRSG